MTNPSMQLAHHRSGRGVVARTARFAGAEPCRPICERLSAILEWSLTTSDDDQIVPLADSALLSAKIVKTRYSKFTKGLHTASVRRIRWDNKDPKTHPGLNYIHGAWPVTVSFSDIIPSRSDPNAFGATDDYPVLGARVWPMLYHAAHEVPAIQQQPSWPPLLPLAL